MRAIAHAATDQWSGTAAYTAAAACFTGFVIAVEIALSHLVY
ncbi:hypothetical protein [Belnapia rosea]|uniref:Uncharacterized protein n=1 Tax=Belnapia rosea TaxID=938405 RepID=A0A1G6WSE1_9PROT|nr:hypothetical protein [Belnapia rosea]SDD68719.1 hypothetical protein SAMN04487779_101141 [Belnapia rosea]